jgi:hypothetical protein
MQRPVPHKGSPSNKSGPPAKKTIFNAAAVVARLSALKEKATEEGAKWWKPAIEFEWSACRKGNNGTQWVAIYYKDADAVKGRLVLRIAGERHVGQIMPSTDDGVAELQLTMKKGFVCEKRTRKPSIQIQKWTVQVKTAEDGVTLVLDEDQKPILPSDDKLSPYYRVAELVGEAYAAEVQERIDRGSELVRIAAESRKENKASVAPQVVLDKFAASHGARTANDAIITSDQVAALRKLVLNVEPLLKGCIQATNSKIASLVQEFISSQSKKNAGSALPNPMTRIAMNFDVSSEMSLVQFFDKDLPFSDNGPQRYEAGKVDGAPINASNVHKFVVPRCSIDGIINMDSVCFSSMGISMPVKADVLVIKRPTDSSIGLDDVYEDGEVVSGQPQAPEQSSAAAAKTEAAAASGKTEVPAEVDYSDVLEGLNIH